MPRVKLPQLHGEAARRAQEFAARLGGEVRASRRRRRWIQAQLAQQVGVVQSPVSDLERVKGSTLPIELWLRVFRVLDRDLRFDVSRDHLEETVDAGHLGMQELVLRLARLSGRLGNFELATKPAEPWRSTDTGIRDDGHRTLILVECWNTIGDIGAAARSTTRKVAEAKQLAVALGGERPFRVPTCWVVRATIRNRALVRRYPEVFAARFPGSSVGWVQALTTGSLPPNQPGLVWCDIAATRVFPWRRGTGPF